jgi:hypothetical protein
MKQGIRLPASREETITIYPKGIRPDSAYSFENIETGETKNISGKDLFTLVTRWSFRRQVHERQEQLQTDGDPEDQCRDNRRDRT